MIDPSGLLMIEPKHPASAEPVLDDLTRMAAVALAGAERSEYGYRGCHFCSCGALSDNQDHFVGPDRLITNSLAAHYLAWHREDVPQSELDKLIALNLPVDSGYALEIPAPVR